MSTVFNSRHWVKCSSLQRWKSINHGNKNNSFEERQDSKGKDTFDVSDCLYHLQFNLQSWSEVVSHRLHGLIHDITVEHPITLVVESLDSGSKGKGRKWKGRTGVGSGKLLVLWNFPLAAWGNPSGKWHIPIKESIIAVEGIDYHFHLWQIAERYQKMRSQDNWVDSDDSNMYVWWLEYGM